MIHANNHSNVLPNKFTPPSGLTPDSYRDPTDLPSSLNVLLTVCNSFIIPSLFFVMAGGYFCKVSFNQF